MYLLCFHHSLSGRSQLDSIAFFPYLSWGANNELAGVATLMAVLEILGSLKRSVSEVPIHGHASCVCVWCVCTVSACVFIWIL